MDNSLSENITKYDCTVDIIEHKNRVLSLITEACKILIERGENHDNSKLLSPEKPLFDEFTPKLKHLTYGSEEYKESLELLKLALDHHYRINSHHPEHYENGINDFDLFDLFELFFDWKAATERHIDGDIYKSLQVSKERFNISEQLYNILLNTAKRLNY